MAKEPTQTILGDQSPTSLPIPKVVNAGIMGMLVAVAIYIAQQFKPDFNPPEWVVSAVTTILMTAIGYLTPPNGFMASKRTMPGHKGPGV